MVTQTSVLENVPVQPEPIRTIRERRWNPVTRQYEDVEVTPAMLEATKRREMYCSMFDPCGVM